MDSNITMDIENILKSIYYDVEHPAGYSSKEKLYRAARKIDKNITRKDINNWWLGEFTPTLHKQVRRNFKRNPIIVEHIDQQWEADLADMRQYARKNHGYGWILTVIDCLSRYAWAVPLKSKKSENIIKGFESILKSMRFPTYLRTDRGKEFLNSKFQKFLKFHRIYHFTSKNNDIKCAMVERFNRTLKTRMHKYFTSGGNGIWFDKIDEFLKSYNNSIHRIIKMTPNEALESTDQELFRRSYGVNNLFELKNKKADYSSNDNVRIVYEKKPFDKSYYPNWSDKIEKVEKIIEKSEKPMFKISNENQTLYPEQIQKVRENLYRIEKILRKRKRNGQTECLVKWLNHPDTYNSWVFEKDLINL